MHELMAANHGYLEANKIPESEDRPMTRDEFDKLKVKIDKIKAEKNGSRGNC